MSMYLDVVFNYLSNINSKFVMRFDYHDNLCGGNFFFKAKG